MPFPYKSPIFIHCDALYVGLNLMSKVGELNQSFLNSLTYTRTDALLTFKRQSPSIPKAPKGGLDFYFVVQFKNSSVSDTD